MLEKPAPVLPRVNNEEDKEHHSVPLHERFIIHDSDNGRNREKDKEKDED